MTSFWLSLALLVTFTVPPILYAEDKPAMSVEHKHEPGFYFTCAMHPDIKEKEAGKCPICGMNLTKVEVEEDDEEDEASNTEASNTEASNTEASNTEASNTKANMSVEHKHEPGFYFTCAMHPDIKEHEAGKCPICGMNLTKVEVEEGDGDEKVETEATSSAEPGMTVAQIKLRKAQLHHFRPTFFTVTTMKMQKKVRLLGTVLQAETREKTIPARTSGRVEKVYIKSTGSKVKRGDAVLDLYSPALITAGEEYLVARRGLQQGGSPHSQAMLAQAEKKLRLWGVKPFQYRSWHKRGKVPDRITIYSPVSGVVRKRHAVAGRYFKEGQNFFELYDLSSVWVEIDVYEHDASLVALGQEVTMQFVAVPGEPLQGEIDFISPALHQASRTLKIRATVPNPGGKLKPGMFADVTLLIELPGMPLVIPRSAIIDTGKRKVIWHKIKNKKFQAKVIQTGYESEGYVEVKSGLSEDEQVVLDGNFLLDAQAQLFGGYQ